MDNNVGMAQRYEHEIPEGYEARIDGNKVIFELKESEDEKIRKQLIGFFSGHYALCKINTKDAIAYLERQKEQKSAEWSEEDEEMIARICANLEYLIKEAGCDSKLKEKLEERIKWMKRLKSLRHQPKAEWSEKDKNALMYLHELISFGFTDNDMREWLDTRLKSLRDNYKKCNSRWKPSEEQMKALQSAIVFVEIRKASDYDISPLKELYEQLKKL